MLAYSLGLTPKEIAEKFNYRYVSSVIHRLRKMGIDIPKYKVPKGDKNRMWKGGIIKRFGYNMVRNTEHPRAGGNGYVFEHILVWEEYHQKQVPLSIDLRHNKELLRFVLHHFFLGQEAILILCQYFPAIQEHKVMN